MKILCSILVGVISLWTPAQFGSVGGNGQPGYSSTAPTYVGQCSAGNSGSATTASCTISIASGDTLAIGTYNFITADAPAISTTTGSPTQLVCNVYNSAMVFCLDVVTGTSGTSVTITATVSAGSYLGLLVGAATASHVDGGTASCSGTTGCSMAGGATLTTTLTGANIVATGNDLVFTFLPVAQGAEVLTGGSTPIALTQAANLAANIRGFYGNASAGTTYATVTGTQTGSATWAFGTIALHP